MKNLVIKNFPINGIYTISSCFMITLHVFVTILWPVNILASVIKCCVFNWDFFDITTCNHLLPINSMACLSS